MPDGKTVCVDSSARDTDDRVANGVRTTDREHDRFGERHWPDGEVRFLDGQREQGDVDLPLAE